MNYLALLQVKKRQKDIIFCIKQNLFIEMQEGKPLQEKNRNCILSCTKRESRRQRSILFLLANFV